MIDFKKQLFKFNLWLKVKSEKRRLRTAERQQRERALKTIAHSMVDNGNRILCTSHAEEKEILKHLRQLGYATELSTSGYFIVINYKKNEAE